MNTQEFGALVKSKYPQYSNVPDDQLGQKMLEKYPQYKSRVDTATPSGTTFAPQRQALTDSAKTPAAYNPFREGLLGAVTEKLPLIGGIAGMGVGGLAGIETGPGTIATGAVGGAVGSGLGEAAREYLRGEQPSGQRIAGEAAMGGIGGAAGPLVGKAAGGILKGATKLPIAGPLIEDLANVGDRALERIFGTGGARTVTEAGLPKTVNTVKEFKLNTGSSDVGTLMKKVKDTQVGEIGQKIGDVLAKATKAGRGMTLWDVKQLAQTELPKSMNKEVLGAFKNVMGIIEDVAKSAREEVGKVATEMAPISERGIAEEPITTAGKATPGRTLIRRRYAGKPVGKLFPKIIKGAEAVSSKYATETRFSPTPRGPIQTISSLQEEADRGVKLTMEQLNTIKQNLQALAGKSYNRVGTIEEEMAKGVATEVRKNIEKLAGDFGPIKQLNQHYQNTRDMLDHLEELRKAFGQLPGGGGEGEIAKFLGNIPGARVATSVLTGGATGASTVGELQAGLQSRAAWRMALTKLFPQIAARAGQKPPSVVPDSTSVADTEIDKTVLQQTGQALGTGKKVYTTDDLIRDLSRDPKNRQIYFGLFDRIEKTQGMSTGQKDALQQRGLALTGKVMMDLVGNSPQLGAIGQAEMKMAQYLGIGEVDQNTQTLTTMLSDYRQLAATLIHHRGMSEASVKTMAFPNPNMTPSAFKKSLRATIQSINTLLQNPVVEGTDLTGASAATATELATP